MSHPALAYRPIFDDRETCLDRFRNVRAGTMRLIDGLAAEDMQIQTMPDVSPTKWHLAHVTWFFETFLAKPRLTGYQAFDPGFGYLFNSYYEQVGDKWHRPDRGLLSRPLLNRILDYRSHVEAAIEHLINSASDEEWLQIAPLLELGRQHEQQHQELLLTDIKHVLSLAPEPYAPFKGPLGEAPGAGESGYIAMSGGLVEIGASQADFVFDNELPRHKRWQEDFEIAARPVSNAEFLTFIEDGGYRDSRLWLSDGWAWVRENKISHPLYWRKTDAGWQEYTLHGLAPLQPGLPVCHVSAYEAAAFAEWQNARLPTETELELLARRHPAEGVLLGCGDRYHPGALTPGDGAQSVFGDVWEWSSSGYEPYPGYHPPDGAVGEYNGKFMSGQQVLRGGSCATGRNHIRATYRNFFPAHSRWQFSGIRLARRTRPASTLASA
ncbi:ergothioneine biosynthesis protein EgtB [Hyphobacterium sp. HN65]|uniref:Ergothioneine biosynthesis protein EgtB n=1 Tax=Hyphobacterium lacteum TaxID=3116575 RepID=A0ABU7LRM8_9PROT|nr:ergothioneine biosynthesis protein EgtB [Hyphobacterium sp. HN65]MEE2526565.1 ergothioneine biosynthesis protein EgtB [Hyphobacterium sp. HN65]